ncbi:pre-rRNA-processing protein ESF2-like [Olea europaea var. sylvestris]|uniref:pre-rRNA-processing protein ESF2-like n=1 Tax=Olea europaea var. sylvestris TaxID=158386 RepID=UPI000C1D633D|nr:pre-rRNA-processing protein ESF2-like [Olea europaea var. sylvestris]
MTHYTCTIIVRGVKHKDISHGKSTSGKKRSRFHYDIWNIKYLSKFKWDDLTEEIAYKSAIREQKLALEISAAKREQDFSLSKVDQSVALSNIEERLKKRQKGEQIKKLTRQFSQKKPVVEETEKKSQLSRDILAGVSIVPSGMPVIMMFIPCFWQFFMINFAFSVRFLEVLELV